MSTEPTLIAEGSYEWYRRELEQAQAEVRHLERRVTTQDTVIGRQFDEIERLQTERDAARLFVGELQGLRDSLFIHLDSASAERDALIDEVKTLQEDLEEFGESQKTWVQFRRERDALKAAVADVRRLCELTIAASCRVQAIDQAVDTLAVLDRALDTPSAPESEDA